MKQIIKNKILKQVFTGWVIFLLIFNPLISTIALAEEPLPSASPTPSSSPNSTLTPDPTPTSPPLPTSTSTPTSSVTTGDAKSQTDNSAQVNSNTDNVPGTVTPGNGCNPPNVTPGCPVSNNNQADTSSTNNSTAQTGQNSSAGNSGGVNINTGEATASAQTATWANTNTVVLHEASSSASEATPSAVFNITSKNDATVKSEATASAGTGENKASNNGGNVNLNTGGALAVGNIFNLINTNTIGSNFKILVINAVDQQGNIDLFNAWKKIAVDEPQDHLEFSGDALKNALQVLVENKNKADINNKLVVRAVSGKNEASNNGGNSNLTSGDATALANITNIVNVNLIGSKMLFVVINILGSFNGNLILPAKEYFESAQSGSLKNSGKANNNNEALVQGDVKALADTGNNQVSNANGSLLKTGQAEAVSHNFSFVNQDFFGYGWFNMFINNLGLQTGQVQGWSNPEAKVDAPQDTAFYSTEASASAAEAISNASETDVQNVNHAKIDNHISAEAISGQNNVSGNVSADVTTGKARALANLFNLANLNIFGSNLFLGMVNLLGNWVGNTVFAYPDLAVAVSGPSNDIKPGDVVNYGVSIKNQGYDDAHNVSIVFEVPKGAGFISDTSGVVPEVSGKNLKWNIGALSAGQQGTFQVQLKIDPNLKPGDLLTFWDKIVPNAYAAEEGIRKKVTVKAVITTSSLESDRQNDSSTFQSTIFFPSAGSNNQNGQNNNETQKPNTTLEIKAWNDVKNFVYQGGIVKFEIDVKNSGGDIAKNVTVYQDIYDGQPESTGSVEFPIGDIEPGKVAKITFGIQVTALKPDTYHTIAKASGDNISANEARTYFEVKGTAINLIPEVKAQETSQGQISGVKGIQVCPVVSKAKREWWPYVLTAMFGTLWFLEMTRRKQWDVKLVSRIRSFKEAK